jgi:protein phosphatase
MNEKKKEGDTVEIPKPVAGVDEGAPPTNSSQVRVELAALSHQGLVRSTNEDYYLVVRYGRMMEKLLSNLPDPLVPNRSEETGYGIIVADGIGGAAAGELASQLAIRALFDAALRTPDWLFGTGERIAEQAEQRMAERYHKADAALRQEAETDPSLLGMGTTMTVARSLGTRLLVGHIGDSRAYLFREGTLHQLTKDHTLVQSLVDAGQLTAEQAVAHPYRHALTRSLGGHAVRGEGEFQHMEIADNDQLLLCTDGLTDIIDSQAIASVLMNAATSSDACAIGRLHCELSTCRP